MRFFCKEFLEPVAYLVYFLVFIRLFFTSGNEKYKMLLGYYCLMTVSIFIASVVDVLDYNNNVIYNILFLVTNFVMARYFILVLTAPAARKTVTIICVAASVLYFYFLIFKYHLENVFSGYAHGPIFLAIIIYCFLYFYQLFSEIKEENLLESFDFWLIGSYLIYYLSAFIIIIYYDTTVDTKRAALWIVQSSILFVSSLLAVIGYVIGSKKRLIKI